MQAHEIEPVALDARQRFAQVFVPDAVFARLATGVDLAAVPVAEAGVDAEPHGVTAAALAELRQHVLRARVDGDAGLQHSIDDGIGQDVRRVDDLGGLGARAKAGSQRAGELTRRHTVDERSCAAQEPQHVQIRAGLLREPHAIEACQARQLLSQHGSIVHVHGGAELRGNVQQQATPSAIHVRRVAPTRVGPVAILLERRVAGRSSSSVQFPPPPICPARAHRTPEQRKPGTLGSHA